MYLFFFLHTSMKNSENFLFVLKIVKHYTRLWLWSKGVIAFVVFIKLITTPFFAIFSKNTDIAKYWDVTWRLYHLSFKNYYGTTRFSISHNFNNSNVINPAKRNQGGLLDTFLNQNNDPIRQLYWMQCLLLFNHGKRNLGYHNTNLYSNLYSPL